jgi:hypothetical protein
VAVDLLGDVLTAGGRVCGCGHELHYMGRSWVPRSGIPGEGSEA